MIPGGHFLSLDDLAPETVGRLLQRAKAVADAPIGDELAGRTVALLFLNPSLRTLSSMQAAVAQRGGSSFVLQPGQGTWGLEWRDGVVMDGDAAEHVREALPVLGSYADLIGVRCFARGRSLAEDREEAVLSAMVKASVRPIVNLESAMDHPCQALADWKTLDDLEVPRRGGRFVLTWAWHPRALPLAVPRAVLGMAAARGMDVTVLRPEGFALPAEVMTRARERAALCGGSVRETADRPAALAGAHVLYAKSWGAPSAYGDPAREAELRAPLRDWCVDAHWFDHGEPDAHFMHCLPVRREVVVRSEVLVGPRSVVVKQAANRLHVQKAILIDLLETT